MQSKQQLGASKSRLTSPSQMMAFICTRSITPAKVSSDPMGSCREHRIRSGQVLAVDLTSSLTESAAHKQRKGPFLRRQPLAWRLTSRSMPLCRHHSWPVMAFGALADSCSEDMPIRHLRALPIP